VIARQSFQNFVATLLSLFWTRRLNPQTVQEIVEVDEASLQHVREIRARGQGIIFITLHYGDWELLGQAIGYYGFPLTIVMEQMRNAALGEIFARLRAHTGHRVIPQRAAAMKLIKTLKRGEGVAMLVDLNAIPGYGGVWLDFFGLPVYNHASAAALALHSGAAIVLGVAYPLGAGRVRAVYGPEIKYTLTGNHTNDLQTINQQCLAACEQVIREHPEHWLWSYRRWKFRPASDQGRYPFYSRFIGEVGRRKATTNADHNTSAPQHIGP
jgi:lauroyl/myristoyl acyltransferase